MLQPTVLASFLVLSSTCSTVFVALSVTTHISMHVHHYWWAGICACIVWDFEKKGWPIKLGYTRCQCTPQVLSPTATTPLTKDEEWERAKVEATASKHCLGVCKDTKLLPILAFCANFLGGYNNILRTACDFWALAVVQSFRTVK